MKYRVKHLAALALLGAILAPFGVQAQPIDATDFSIVGFSDTQYSVEAFPQIINSQTQWMADHANDPAYNIAFVAHQGDLLRRGYSNTQATVASNALGLLDNVVPYSVSIGNHDYDNQFDDLDRHVSSANITSFFGNDRFQNIATSGFGGSSLDERNRYFTFTAAGQQYLVLSLEWEAPDAAIAYGQSVINSHRDLPVILTTHEYLRSTGRSTSPLDPAANAGEAIFQKLVKNNPQIFMVLSGHTGAVYHQTSLNSSTNPDWQPVYEAVSDFEGRANGGNGFFQLFHFYPSQNKIDVTSYSPYLNQWDSSSSAYQFSFPLNVGTRFSFANNPIANDDSFNVVPGIEYSGNVITNDHAPTGAVTATLATSTTHGALTLNVDGSFTYTADTGFAGTDTFSYTVTDGTTTSNLATVKLIANDAPVAVDDAITTTEGKSINYNPVANDSDANGDALKAILKSLPAHGALYVESNGTFTYTPDPKFVGTDTFTYVTSDSIATGNVATTTVTVGTTTPAVVYAYPVSETTVSGTRSGSMANVQARDGVKEVISTVLRNGDADAEHRWQFNVTAGSQVTLAIDANRSWGNDEYDVQYSTNGGTTWTAPTQIVTASSRAVTRINSEDAEPYQMWRLPATTAGTVWVRVIDNATNTDLGSISIDEVHIQTVDPVVITLPLAPLNLTGTYSKSTRKETLKWTDASNNETGFKVSYSTNGGTTWTYYSTLAANTTTFTTPALTRNVTYSFRVNSTNSAGDSAFSNTITQLTN